MTDRKCSVHFKTADSVQISVILMWLEPSELELQIAGHPTPSFLRLRKISRRIVHDLANTRSVFNLGPPILNCTRLCEVDTLREHGNAVFKVPERGKENFMVRYL